MFPQAFQFALHALLTIETFFASAVDLQLDLPGGEG